MVQKQASQTAIARFKGDDRDFSINVTTVYATYTSGSFLGYYSTEQEAIDHCADPSAGAEFNGQWISDTYSMFEAGHLCLVEDRVYVSSDRAVSLDPIASSDRMEFVTWVKYIK